jgi:hypothetical protein
MLHLCLTTYMCTVAAMPAAAAAQEYISEACSDVSCRRWMVNENLQRCLTIEPPEPALKLETLSEIAQVGLCAVLVNASSLQLLLPVQLVTACAEVRNAE